MPTQMTPVEAINQKYRTPDAKTKLALIDTPEGRKRYRAELAQVVGLGNHMTLVGPAKRPQPLGK